MSINSSPEELLLIEAERLVAELRYQLNPLRKYRDLTEKNKQIQKRRWARIKTTPMLLEWNRNRLRERRDRPGVMEADNSRERKRRANAEWRARRRAYERT